jgi:hypothetical protein
MSEASSYSSSHYVRRVYIGQKFRKDFLILIKSLYAYESSVTLSLKSEASELGASTLRSETPIGARSKPVALSAPRLRLPPEGLHVRQPSSEALPNQNRELDLHHVQPRAVHHRCVDEFDLLSQATGDCRWEALVVGRRLMSREVVAY